MKLVRESRTETLQGEIKREFTEFRRNNRPSKNCRYPKNLQELVCRGAAQGMQQIELRRLTGLSLSAIKRWIGTSKSGGIASPKIMTPRRLEVELPKTQSAASGVVIRLPSGVTLELSDHRSLSHELLTALSIAGVGHAATC